VDGKNDILIIVILMLGWAYMSGTGV